MSPQFAHMTSTRGGYIAPPARSLSFSLFVSLALRLPVCATQLRHRSHAPNFQTLFFFAVLGLVIRESKRKVRGDSLLAGGRPPVDWLRRKSFGACAGHLSCPWVTSCGGFVVRTGGISRRLSVQGPVGHFTSGACHVRELRAQNLNENAPINYFPRLAIGRENKKLDAAMFNRKRATCTCCCKAGRVMTTLGYVAIRSS